MSKQQLNDMADRMRLVQRFDEFVASLPGEGFPDDEITDAMIRSLCRRIGRRDLTVAWVEDIAEMWFDK